MTVDVIASSEVSLSMTLDSKQLGKDIPTLMVTYIYMFMILMLWTYLYSIVVNMYVWKRCNLLYMQYVIRLKTCGQHQTDNNLLKLQP